MEPQQETRADRMGIMHPDGTAAVAREVLNPCLRITVSSRDKHEPNSYQSLGPIAPEKSKILILGSIPGEASLKAAHHGRTVRGRPVTAISGKSGAASVSRRRCLDALQECVRPGSLDASITQEVANDLPTFFAKYSNVTHVFFNGRKAQAAFSRHVLPALTDGRHIFARLPSTSSAHAVMTLEAKVQAWSVVRKVLC